VVRQIDGITRRQPPAVPVRRHSLTALRTKLSGLIRSLRSKLSGLPRRTYVAVGLTAAAIVVAYGVIGHPGWLRSDQNGTSPITRLLTRGTPDYSTITPAGRSVDDLGGWARVSPPYSSPVYSFVDKIDGVQINVSEQPLPKDFQTDTASHIERTATDFNATEKVQAKSTVFYIGTASNGPQSVIFTKNGLLILIKSGAPLTTSQWATYIDNLR
jgi:hypothetical protein